MLVYVAMQVLNYLIGGPWKDPNGHNFPQTPPFSPAQSLPHVMPGTVIPPGFVVAIVLTLVFWMLTDALGLRLLGPHRRRRARAPPATAASTPRAPSGRPS